jgi:hypothetical protein
VTVDGASKRGQSIAPAAQVRSLRLLTADLDFESGASDVHHLIDRTIDGFATQAESNSSTIQHH